jgi:hypothetical protein
VSHIDLDRGNKDVVRGYSEIENAIPRPNEESNSCLPSLSREDVPESNLEGSDSGELQAVETADDVACGERTSKRIVSKKARNQPSEDDPCDVSKDSNIELNVNTRPRRSVARKSVFELLQVEYRGSGGSRKHNSNVPEGDREAGNVVTSPKAKKTPSKSPGHKRPKEPSVRQRDEIEDKAANDEDVNHSLSLHDHSHRKTVIYTPDDFLTEAAAENGLQLKPGGSSSNRLKAGGKSRISIADKLKSSESSAFGGQGENQLQNTFAAEFELASADVLSNSKSGDSASKSELDLMAENNRLRARLKALEESNSVVKKFQIDFHSRKFSRIRTPTASTGLVRPDVTSGSESAKVSEVSDVEEAWKSRSALLDRREHKLRELSAELDERTSAVRISEGALQRRERKLIELEKTLEYRERVLSRHEQNIQKRELELEVGGNGEQATATDDPSAERSTLIAEFQKRFDLRRQELDRRQNLLQTEREKLVEKERELERREHELELKLQSQWNSKESSAGDVEEDTVDDKPAVTKNVSMKAKAKKRSLPADQPPVKKAKVAVCFSLPFLFWLLERFDENKNNIVFILHL